MEKENLYLIHGEDYLRHIEEKLELLWMATILMHYIKNGAEKDGYDEDSEADTDATISSLYALLSVSDCLSKLAAGLISASDHLLELLDKELRSYGD